MGGQDGQGPCSESAGLAVFEEKKKQYEQHLYQLTGTQFNLERTQFQQEQAEITVLTAQAMQEGHQQMMQQRSRMGGVEQVERMRDDMEDISTELSAAQDAMAREGATVGSPILQDALDVEWERLRAEVLGTSDTASMIAMGSTAPRLAEVVQAASYPSVEFGTESTFGALPVSRLKAIARYHGISIQGCTEREDLIVALQSAGISGGVLVEASARPERHTSSPARHNLSTCGRYQEPLYA